MALQKILKNGVETGGTAADKINAIISAVNLLSSTNLTALSQDVLTNQTNIAANTVDIGTNTTDIAANATAIGVNSDKDVAQDVIIQANSDDIVVLQGLTSLQMLSLITTSPRILPLTTLFTKITFADVVNIELLGNSISHDPALHTITVLEDGVYVLTANGSITGTNGAVATFSYFLNGVELVLGASPSYTTTGTGKPIAIGDHRFLNLAVNDVLDVRAKVDADTNITIVASNLAIKKES